MDTLSDMLTVIRNGLAAKKRKVSVPYSCFKEEIARLLRKEGYLRSVKKLGKEKKESLAIGLKYVQGQPAIKEIEPISKAGKRVYAPAKDLRVYKPYGGRGKGIGIIVVSTSKGLMTASQAKKKNLGGQLLFKLY